MDESLSTKEEQLTELEEQNFNERVRNEYWAGGSSMIIIIIIIIIMYFGKNWVQKCFNNSKRTAKKRRRSQRIPISNSYIANNAMNSNI